MASKENPKQRIAFVHEPHTIRPTNRLPSLNEFAAGLSLTYDEDPRIIPRGYYHDRDILNRFNRANTRCAPYNPIEDNYTTRSPRQKVADNLVTSFEQMRYAYQSVLPELEAISGMISLKIDHLSSLVETGIPIDALRNTTGKAKGLYYAIENFTSALETHEQFRKESSGSLPILTRAAIQLCSNESTKPSIDGIRIVPPNTESITSKIRAHSIDSDASFTPPKKQKVVVKQPLRTSCKECGNTETPEWRKGPDGPRTLCNACGLRFGKLLRKFDEARATELFRLARK